jgi:LmbE family N-acetylglucosaminyl deacetylase
MDLSPSDASSPAMDLLEKFSGAGPISVSTALVVAHPDDESIAMSGTVARLTRLTMIHATDGAPKHFEPSGRFSTKEDLLRTRIAETDQALKAALAHPIRRLRYEFTDGEVIDHIETFIDRLCIDLMFCEAVITHAYEGGHIDHDACSIAVQIACLRLQRLVGRAPARLEFAGYYAQRGKVRAAQFTPREGCNEVVVNLSATARRRRELAFAAHRSQEGNLRFFNVARECYRQAPHYDFSRLPPTPLYNAIEQGRIAQKVKILASAFHS